MPNPIVHWEVAAKDAAKAREFYSKLFDWDIKKWEGPMEYYDVNTRGEGINGGLTKAEGFPNYVTIYVKVDDLQATLDKANKLGGKTLVPQTPIPTVGAFAMFMDPDGNVIGLFK
jgi:predicted enzyme related to lactoylglutathione lyase